MTDTLYPEQVELEEEVRGLTIRRFEKEHDAASRNDTFSETFIGSYLVGQYLNPFAEGITSWLKQANSGKAGRKHVAAKYINNIDAPTVAFLFLKAILNRVGTYRREAPCTYTSLAIYGAGLIHDEIRLRFFEDENPQLSKKIHQDFASRELPRYKREEYMRKAFAKLDLEWNVWTTSEHLHVGSVLIDIFYQISGDIFIQTVGKGKRSRNIVVTSEDLLKALERTPDYGALS